MAASVTTKGQRVVITGIDADWTAGQEYKLLGGSFSVGAANDTVVIKEDTDAGAVLLQLGSTGAVSTDVKVLPAPVTCTPMVDFSACTVSAGHVLTLFVG